ncbi:MAG TPA: ATP-binding protein [Gammaproteobacteria bacterium]
MHGPHSRAAARRSARIPVEPARDAEAIFDSGGRMGRLMRTRDWSTTSLGPAESWPECLKTPLRLMLASPAPTFIWWGPELVYLHNDACARLFGRQRSLGKPAAEVREEIWDAIGAEVCEVLESNAAVSAAERRMLVGRGGRERELYCSFSLTPIRDEWGAAVGVFGTGTDETAAVVARRRLAALSRLGGVAKADTLHRVGEWSAAALAADVHDAPFALVYFVDESERVALAGSAGTLPGNLKTARADRASPWPLEQRGGGDVPRVAELPPEIARAAPDAAGAAVLPLGFRAPGVRDAYLVVGITKQRPLDDEYRAFLTAAAGLVSAGLAAAALRDDAPSRDADDERRDEFLAMLAHELRNPLAPIRSAAELLAYVDSNPMSLPHARAIIERQLAQLVRLVDDLLDVSRISRGTLELKRAPLDLRSAIASAVESVRPLVDSGRHELRVQMPRTAIPLHGDHARLTQALANLLTNAAQYTNPGGHIDIGVDADGREARIHIADDGIGLDPEFLPRAFEMFTQGEQRSGEPRRGLGIGLAVARRLIELHGGTITAASPGRNRGSEFVVTLPLSGTRPAQRRTHGNGIQPHPRRILVADDNADAATAMAEILAVIGHDVRTAVDGLEAIEVAERFRPDLILLDIGMPRIDGYEACRRIRARAWARHVPIYAVTGWGQPSDRRRTREAGFTAHLVKPVSIDAINALLAARDPG